MKKIRHILQVFLPGILLLTSGSSSLKGKSILFESDPDLSRQIIVRKYRLKFDFLHARAEHLERLLGNTKDTDHCNQFHILTELRKVDKAIRAEEYMADAELVCFRYRKGIEVLKMIFEKILSLDHHFSSLGTHQDILALSNPNSFPEFRKYKESTLKHLKSRNKARIPELLDNNSLFSMGYTLVYSFFGNNDRKKKESETEAISCLLDFTLSMQSDLKIIYYETDYLRIQNEELKKRCFELFDDYTGILGYEKGLDYCRSKDDWDLVFQKLLRLEELLVHRQKMNNASRKLNSRDLNQLRFSVDLLMNFSERYTRFVYQGELYYQKFLDMLKNYSNRDGCSPVLPEHYLRLENEMSLAIEKFNSAYNIAELRGSKLKELMYGAPEG